MTKLTVGQSLYSISNEPDGKATVDTYVVRTIRGGKITAIWKLAGITWGKRSPKTGDYGWLAKIPAWCRKTWTIASMEKAGRSGPFAYSLFTTKRAAILDAIKSAVADDFDTVEQFDRYVSSLKRMKP